MTDSNPTLLTGDARNLEMIDDETVDLIVTSPPYNLGVDYDSTDDDLDESEYRSFLEDVLEECYRVLSSDGRIAVNVGLGVGRPIVDLPSIVRDCASEAGFSLRGKYVWDKGAAESSSAWGSWRSASNPREIIVHEMILVFYADSPGRHETRSETLPKDDFMQSIKSVLRVDPETNVDHPAPFPPEIPCRLIQLHSYRGDTVLDPFSGTGTTCAVAAALDREAIGVDVSEKYTEMARERCRGFSLDAVDVQSEVGQSTLAESWG